MKKEKFTYEDGGLVKLKKSIKEYDEEHGRSTYFDKLFAKKY